MLTDTLPVADYGLVAEVLSNMCLTTADEPDSEVWLSTFRFLRAPARAYA